MRSRGGGAMARFLLLLSVIAGVAAMHVLGHLVAEHQAGAAPTPAGHTVARDAPDRPQAAVPAGEDRSGHQGMLDPLETCLAVLGGSLLLFGALAAVMRAARPAMPRARAGIGENRRWTRAPPAPSLSLRLTRVAVLRI